MLTHFTYKRFFSKETRQNEYLISFFHKGTSYKAIYHYNGKITWQNETPALDDTERLISDIHELMLFHVYDK